MAEWDQVKATSIFNKFAGLTDEDYNWGLQNPANKEVLMALDHNDVWGMESKFFAVCFQRVRN